VELAIYQVDAFSKGPFSGNPAAVCITPDALAASTMQKIAAEMAVSETAFLTLNNRQLRWFTPLAEVDLCGHATLATAHILRQTGQLKVGESIEFTTLSGPLTATAREESIELDFPLAHAFWQRWVCTSVRLWPAVNSGLKRCWLLKMHSALTVLNRISRRWRRCRGGVWR